MPTNDNPGDVLLIEISVPFVLCFQFWQTKFAAFVVSLGEFFAIGLHGRLLFGFPVENNRKGRVAGLSHDSVHQELLAVR